MNMNANDALFIGTLAFMVVYALREVWPRVAGREGYVTFALTCLAAVYRLVVFEEPLMLVACIAGAAIAWPLVLWIRRMGWV
jgi:hypothetical protein